MDYLFGPNETLENGIYIGDAMKLSSYLPNNSVDLIFTDPPYPKKFLYLYEWLASEAPRLLKPNGFLCVYAGIYYKADIMRMFDKTMSYFWDIVAVNFQGASPIIWPRKIISKYKSILVYHLKGNSPLPRTNVLSAFNGTKQDKRFHVWQQDLSTARYYIDCFSPKQPSLILDPFCGGGTIPYVCKQLRYPYLSFEIDETSAIVARDRIKNAYQPVLFDNTISDDFLLSMGVENNGH